MSGTEARRGTAGFVGAGAVGPAIARRLREAGWRIGTIASRSLESARRAVEFVGAGRPSDRNEEAARGADLLFLTVPDRAIAEVAAEIAPAVGPGVLALHVSGAQSSSVLSPLAAAGATIGSLHPLASFTDPGAAARRLGSAFLFYEGDDPDRIRAVAEDLGGRPVPIETAGKALYHAGAAAACNLGVAMVDLGVGLMEAAGIPRDAALEALLPLLRGTLDNLERVGLPAALTGPVARGDAGTVAVHLEEIRRARPELLAPYVAASRHAVRIGIEKGSLPADAAKEIEALLDRAGAG